MHEFNEARSVAYAGHSAPITSPQGVAMTATRRAHAERLEASFWTAAEQLATAMAAAEDALVAVATGADRVSKLARMYVDAAGGGGVLVHTPSGVIVPVDPAAAVIAATVPGLAAGDAAASWPQVLDQAAAVRESLAIPRQENTR